MSVAAAAAAAALAEWLKSWRRVSFAKVMGEARGSLVSISVIAGSSPDLLSYLNSVKAE
jgi:hypothetical protein